MYGSTRSRRSYLSESGWRRIQARLPAPFRLRPGAEPTEEWLRAGRFAVHLDCWRRDDAPATLVLVHGGGGNGRLLAPYGAMAAMAGYEVVAPDLPGYGMTEVPRKRSLSYEDWRDALSCVLESEARRGRAVVVFGLSMGGMLAYDVTERTRIPRGLVATCLLDPRRPEVRRSLVRWPRMAPLVGPMLSTLSGLIDPLPVPMRSVANMRGVANDAKLARTIATDRYAGGNWMPARFLRTFINAAPLVAPEDFDVCPVLLVHPGDDRWTDVSISRGFFDRLAVEKRLVILDNAGHLPVEEPGATQLRTALLEFLAACSSAAR